MSRTLAILGVFALAFPIGIEAPYDSGGASGRMTRVSIAGGVGYYALITRGCDGSVIGHQPVHFREVGADVEHQVVGPLHVGIRGGSVREELGPDGPGRGGSYVEARRYVNPYVSVESPRMGFGLGPIYSKEEMPRDGPGFSAHLRIGGRNRYFSTSLMENVPLSSGGGYFDLGVGFHPRPRVDWWIGLSSAPFDGAGAAIKTAWRVSPRSTLDLNARLGFSGGEPQNGVALGITTRFGKPSVKVSGKEPTTTSRTH